MGWGKRQVQRLEARAVSLYTESGRPVTRVRRWKRWVLQRVVRGGVFSFEAGN